MTSCRYSTKQFYANSGTVTKRGREWKDIDGRYKQLKHNHRNYGVRTLVVPVVSKCGTGQVDGKSTQAIYRCQSIVIL